MAEPSQYQYETTARCKPEAGLAPTDATADREIAFLAQVGSGAINQHCRRIFTAYPDTKDADAPATAYLEVDDLLAVTALTAYGSPIDASAYALLTEHPWHPYALTSLYPHYARLRHNSAVWATLGSGLAYQQIRITGTWGYSAAVPDEVRLATRMLVARLWRAKIIHFDDTGGGFGQPEISVAGSLIAGDLARLLQPFTRGQESRRWPA